MCGIAGFIDFTKRSTREQLQKITDVLEHRGPDGSGFLFEDRAEALLGLGHRRLSIIDLSPAGTQPMRSENLVITFNGEIYNYREVQEELKSLGHSFNSNSDTEVVLRSWEQWGEDAVHKWRGMFALAMFDYRTEELICIRDRAGVKPFYYYYEKGLFIFGSELKSLMAHPAYEKEVDTGAAASFLQYGYVSAPHTIFKNTHKLRPGFMLRISLKNRSTTSKQYWNIYDYYNRPKLTISLQEAVDETEKLMRESFNYRMVADVPVGIFLSGGYDSTCVSAILQNSSRESLHTFTIGMEDNKFNEAHHARKIARFLGTRHTDHYCSPNEALRIIPDLPEYYDEPYADSSAIPTILVSRLSREQVTVALSADGADEVFAGYKKYDYLSKYKSKLDALPSASKKLLATITRAMPSKNIPFLRKNRLFHSQYSKLKILLEQESSRDLPKAFLQAISDHEVHPLLRKEVQLPATMHDSNELQAAYYDDLSYHLGIDFQTYLPDDNLQKVDRATMSVALEGREPFLDHKLVEWAAQLPSAYKNHEGTKKFIIKKIVHKYVPTELMDRPKQGFEVPISSWFKHELKDLLEDSLNENELNKFGLLNPSAVKEMMQNFQKGQENYSMNLWYLLMFQLWSKRWL